MTANNNQDGGTFDNRDPLAVTSADLILKLGSMLVEIISKDKVIEAITTKVTGADEERVTLAKEVDDLRASLPSKDAEVKKHRGEVNRLESEIAEIKKVHQDARKATDASHKEQLIAKGLDIAKLETFVNDQEIRNRDVVDTMQDKIVTLELEIQSLKDHKTASNGASHVIPDKPTHKKQGKKYTKKAAKTTASA